MESVSKIILTTVFLLLSYINTFSQSSLKKYPSLENIESYFSSNYSLREIPKSQKIRFEKRPSGWYITKRKRILDSLLSENQLWNSSENEYIHIDSSEFITRKKFSMGKNQIDYISSLDRILFNLIPFYGYPGWDWDMINKYPKPQSIKNDTLLYSIASAYSSYSSNLLHNYFNSYSSKEHSFNLPEGANSLNSIQLKKYRYYAHNSTRLFELVKEMNPSFDTFVGGIEIKTANEHMVPFLNLLMFQNEEVAMKEIEDFFYPSFYINVAKNFLSSCKKDAILFVGGDSDTFPLLFVQAKLGFRKDVTVVNTSLLNISRYIETIRNGVIGSKPLPISFTADQIKDKVRNYIYLKEDTTGRGAMRLKVFIDLTKDKSYIKHANELSYYSLPSSSFTHEINGNKLVWKINKKGISRSNLVILDIIANNNQQRPIYFSTTLGRRYYLGLSDYLELQGMAYELKSQKYTEHSNSSNIGYIDADILYKNLMNNFIWDDIVGTSNANKIFCKNYRSVFHYLIQDLIRLNKNKKAIKALNKCFNVLPNEKVKYDIYNVCLAEDYYILDKPKNANSILEVMINTLKVNNNVENYEHKVKYISYLAEKYKQTEISKQLEGLNF